MNNLKLTNVQVILDHVPFSSPMQKKCILKLKLDDIVKNKNYLPQQASKINAISRLLLER